MTSEQCNYFNTLLILILALAVYTQRDTGIHRVTDRITTTYTMPACSVLCAEKHTKTVLNKHMEEGYETSTRITVECTFVFDSVSVLHTATF